MAVKTLEEIEYKLDLLVKERGLDENVKIKVHRANLLVPDASGGCRVTTAGEVVPANLETARRFLRAGLAVLADG